VAELMKSLSLFFINGASGAVAALLFYFVFELVTGQAFGLLQPFLAIPYLGTFSTEWLVVSVFGGLYIFTAYLGSRVLPDSALSDRFVSFLVGVYLFYALTLLAVVFVTLPDTVFKGSRFMNVARPLLLSPETMLLFMLLPSPAVLANYKKRRLRLIAPKTECAWLVAMLALWAGAAMALINLASHSLV
jgi:hypothetical protein